MKVCLKCREEYVDHIDSCSDCKAPLVEASQACFDAAPRHNDAKAALLKEEMLVFSEGSLESCREMEKILTKASTPCAVYPVNLGCGDNAATLGTTCASKYMVLIRPDDLQHCRDVLEGRFEDQIAKEGLGNYVKEAVNLEEDGIICPACQEQCTLQNGECSSCGLFLGAPN